MKYFILQVCAALRLMESFKTKTCTRGSDFTMRIDDHYDEMLLTAEILSPNFLYLNQRFISIEVLSNMHSNVPMNILDMDYMFQTPILLDSQSLVFYDSTYDWNISLTQQFMHPSISYYEKLLVSSYIILYNRSSIVFFTYSKVYPRFITEYSVDKNLTCACLYKDLVIVADLEKIFILGIEDISLGVVRVSQRFGAEEMNLEGFRISKMIVKDDFLYVLDQKVGLFQLSLNPLRLLKFFNLNGKIFADCKDVICIDGKFIINLITSKIISYNISEECEHLSLDDEFIYCASGDYVIYQSRLLPIQKKKITRPIKSIMSKNSILFTAFKDSVKVEQVTLSPLYAIGSAPNKVKDYSIKLKVWSTNGETDSQEFTLKVLYTLTDVILFILFSLFILFFIVSCILLIFKFCKKKTDEKQVYNVPIRQDSVIPGENTIRNPFSDRRLVERTQ